jgi:hypothetical protein
VWYRALNAGFRLPAGAGTDAMANYAILRGPVGMNRVYVRVPGKLTHRGFLDGLKAGRTFVTNGPLLEFTLNGLGAGREIRLPEGRHQLQARVSLRSFVGVDHLEIVRNGVVVRDLPLGGDRTRALESLTLPVQESGWYLLRAYGDKARHPVLDWYPAATTSPIYVSVGGRPVRSPDDLAYFIAWIKRLESVAAANPEWNSEGEKEEALRSFRAAREELERRGGGSNE